MWIKRSGGAGCSLEVNKQGGLEGVEGGGGLEGVGGAGGIRNRGGAGELAGEKVQEGQKDLYVQGGLDRVEVAESVTRSRCCKGDQK